MGNCFAGLQITIIIYRKGIFLPPKAHIISRHPYSFSRCVVPSDETDKPLNESWFVLTASGSFDDAGAMRQHDKMSTSGCKCNVTDCTDDCFCLHSFRYFLLKLHGESNHLSRRRKNNLLVYFSKLFLTTTDQNLTSPPPPPPPPPPNSHQVW